MSSVTIKVTPGVTGFAEDKDEARKLRLNNILPALKGYGHVIIDCGDVTYSTQSFIHALIGEVLQIYKEPILSRIEFRACSPQVQSLIELVVDYSLGGFSPETHDMKVHSE